MANFKLEFSMDSEAFHDTYGSFEPDIQICSILQKVEQDVRVFHADGGIIRDVNGNKVGEWGITV